MGALVEALPTVAAEERERPRRFERLPPLLTEVENLPMFWLGLDERRLPPLPTLSWAGHVDDASSATTPARTEQKRAMPLVLSVISLHITECSNASGLARPETAQPHVCTHHIRKRWGHTSTTRSISSKSP